MISMACREAWACITLATWISCDFVVFGPFQTGHASSEGEHLVNSLRQAEAWSMVFVAESKHHQDMGTPKSKGKMDPRFTGSCDQHVA